jgi:hypothetical protein
MIIRMDLIRASKKRIRWAVLRRTRLKFRVVNLEINRQKLIIKCKKMSEIKRRYILRKKRIVRLKKHLHVNII